MPVPYHHHSLCLQCGDPTGGEDRLLCDGCFDEEVKRRAEQTAADDVVEAAHSHHTIIRALLTKLRFARERADDLQSEDHLEKMRFLSDKRRAAAHAADLRDDIDQLHRERSLRAAAIKDLENARRYNNPYGEKKALHTLHNL